eukprot:GHVN01051262.1.p1 GENE.GHVN01051262.1~~GHVN01051262.1.p1  ORF type:complete len:1758 (+),score=269.55 GHVN01051262.1:218-5491(+)
MSKRPPPEKRRMCSSTAAGTAVSQLWRGRQNQSRVKNIGGWYNVTSQDEDDAPPSWKGGKPACSNAKGSHRPRSDEGRSGSDSDKYDFAPLERAGIKSRRPQHVEEIFDRAMSRKGIDPNRRNRMHADNVDEQGNYYDPDDQPVPLICPIPSRGGKPARYHRQQLYDSSDFRRKTRETNSPSAAVLDLSSQERASRRLAHETEMKRQAAAEARKADAIPESEKNHLKAKQAHTLWTLLKKNQPSAKPQPAGLVGPYLPAEAIDEGEPQNATVMKNEAYGDSRTSCNERNNPNEHRGGGRGRNRNRNQHAPANDRRPPRRANHERQTPAQVLHHSRTASTSQYHETIHEGKEAVFTPSHQKSSRMRRGPWVAERKFNTRDVGSPRHGDHNDNAWDPYGLQVESTVTQGKMGTTSDSGDDVRKQKQSASANRRSRAGSDLDGDEFEEHEDRSSQDEEVGERDELTEDNGDVNEHVLGETIEPQGNRASVASPPLKQDAIVGDQCETLAKATASTALSYEQVTDEAVKETINPLSMLKRPVGVGIPVPIGYGSSVEHIEDFVVEAFPSYKAKIAVSLLWTKHNYEPVKTAIQKMRSLSDETEVSNELEKCAAEAQTRANAKLEGMSNVLERLIRKSETLHTTTTPRGHVRHNLAYHIIAQLFIMLGDLVRYREESSFALMKARSQRNPSVSLNPLTQGGSCSETELPAFDEEGVFNRIALKGVAPFERSRGVLRSARLYWEAVRWFPQEGHGFSQLAVVALRSSPIMQTFSWVSNSQGCLFESAYSGLCAPRTVLHYFQSLICGFASKNEDSLTVVLGDLASSRGNDALKAMMKGNTYHVASSPVAARALTEMFSGLFGAIHLIYSKIIGEFKCHVKLLTANLEICCSGLMTNVDIDWLMLCVCLIISATTVACNHPAVARLESYASIIRDRGRTIEDSMEELGGQTSGKGAPKLVKPVVPFALKTSAGITTLRQSSTGVEELYNTMPTSLVESCTLSVQDSLKTEASTLAVALLGNCADVMSRRISEGASPILAPLLYLAYWIYSNPEWVTVTDSLERSSADGDGVERPNPCPLLPLSTESTVSRAAADSEAMKNRIARGTESMSNLRRAVAIVAAREAYPFVCNLAISDPTNNTDTSNGVDVGRRGSGLGRRGSRAGGEGEGQRTPSPRVESPDTTDAKGQMTAPLTQTKKNLQSEEDGEGQRRRASTAETLTGRRKWTIEFYSLLQQPLPEEYYYLGCLPVPFQVPFTVVDRAVSAVEAAVKEEVERREAATFASEAESNRENSGVPLSKEIAILETLPDPSNEMIDPVLLPADASVTNEQEVAEKNSPVEADKDERSVSADGGSGQETNWFEHKKASRGEEMLFGVGLGKEDNFGDDGIAAQVRLARMWVLAHEWMETKEAIEEMMNERQTSVPLNEIISEDQSEVVHVGEEVEHKEEGDLTTSPSTSPPSKPSFEPNMGGGGILRVKLPASAIGPRPPVIITPTVQPTVGRGRRGSHGGRFTGGVKGGRKGKRSASKGHYNPFELVAAHHRRHAEYHLPGHHKLHHRVDGRHPQSSINERMVIVLDGSNIAMRHGELQSFKTDPLTSGSPTTGCTQQQKVFSTQGLKLAVDYYLRLNCRVVTVVPEHIVDYAAVGKNRRAQIMGFAVSKAKTPDNVQLLRSLGEQNMLAVTPSQDYDDSYAIKYAQMHGGCVVSNDRFRDYVDRCADKKRATEWIKTHVISFTFMSEDEFVPNPDFTFPAPLTEEDKARGGDQIR